ncbi:Dynactin subunit 4 [Trichuris trichiura]|uniref:Dynactin subunit 4 n=1 Tax=Trichuris trichiura TaxID=36087 RepID=A0A077YW08_TRITR|nr:Dynactin subunit 4 [Trichuris trichiura]
MSTLYDVEATKYLCTCGNWVPLCRLYFCKYCLVLRCAACATSEVDSVFCPSCLENMTSGEARTHKNRYLFLLTEPSGEKLYRLYCQYCCWSSKEAGLPDQTSATRAWPEPAVDNAKSVYSFPFNQRLKIPETQPQYVSELLPLRKPLVVRKSVRCRSCEHNVIRGEYVPSSVKFKIQFCAMLLVPEVRLLKRPLMDDDQFSVFLTVTNFANLLDAVSCFSWPIKGLAAAVTKKTTAAERVRPGNSARSLQRTTRFSCIFSYNRGITEMTAHD